MSLVTRYDKIAEYGDIILMRDTESGEFVVAQGPHGDRQELYRSHILESAEHFFGDVSGEISDEEDYEESEEDMDPTNPVTLLNPGGEHD